MSSRLYVGNLPYEINDSSLADLFTVHGSVTAAQVIKDRDTGRSKGFGFVEMSSSDEAKAAIIAMSGSEVGGRTLTVNEARPREERRGNFGTGARNGMYGSRYGASSRY
jgi:RNA recognition motif-containing protein